MNHIVSAVFDSHAEAERAVAELRAAGVRDSALSVIARHDSGQGDYGDANTHEAKEKGEGALKGALGGGAVGALLGIAALAIPGVGPLAAAGAIAASAVPEAVALGAGAGALAGGLSGLLAKHGVSEDDARYYEGRINDGGVFVSVDTRDGGISPDRAQGILTRAGGHSSSQPRSTTQPMSTAQPMSTTQPASTGSTGGAFAFGSGSATTTAASGGQAIAEEHIPIVEEELRVGKREVEQGGVRVHSHVVEQPVHEEVRLREEHVEIERRPVSGSTANLGADAFQERTVEMDATAEEAVVAKEAVVREELVVRKEASQRTETIDDTVRRTEVDVDKDVDTTDGRSRF
jgi:uncharacterized protein (TIGR02271 family)